MTAILKEPLLHFAVLGIGVFALYGFVDRNEQPAADEIVIDGERVVALAEQFARARQRAPTPSELDGLVDDYIREEVMYREGLALGLDRDDSVIRNRVRVKMELLAQGLGVPPSDAELQAWLDANEDRYMAPARYDVRQIFFDPARRANLERDVEAALRELALDADWTSFGDPTLLPAVVHGATHTEIAAQFGEPYATALAGAPSGRWLGAVTSAYGAHIVRVDTREEPRNAVLADVRDEVERDLRSSRADAASEALYERLRARYTVHRVPLTSIFSDAQAEASP